MQNQGGSTFHLNQFEYGYLVEDTDRNATSMKIFIPKLMGVEGGGTGRGSVSVDKGIVMNKDKNSVGTTSSVATKQYMDVPVVLPYEHQHPEHNCQGYNGQNNCPNTNHQNKCHHPGPSILAPCPHDHHDHHFPHLGGRYGKIPAGSRVIVMFMDNNVNDCRVTRMICDFPNGLTNGGMKLGNAKNP